MSNFKLEVSVNTAGNFEFEYNNDTHLFVNGWDCEILPADKKLICTAVREYSDGEHKIVFDTRHICSLDGVYYL